MTHQLTVPIEFVDQSPRDFFVAKRAWSRGRAAMLRELRKRGVKPSCVIVLPCPVEFGGMRYEVYQMFTMRCLWQWAPCPRDGREPRFIGRIDCAYEKAS